MMVHQKALVCDELNCSKGCVTHLNPALGPSSPITVACPPPHAKNKLYNPNGVPGAVGGSGADIGVPSCAVVPHGFFSASNSAHSHPDRIVTSTAREYAVPFTSTDTVPG